MFIDYRSCWNGSNCEVDYTRVSPIQPLAANYEVLTCNYYNSFTEFVFIIKVLFYALSNFGDSIC